MLQGGCALREGGWIPFPRTKLTKGTQIIFLFHFKKTVSPSADGKRKGKGAKGQGAFCVSRCPEFLLRVNLKT